MTVIRTAAILLIRYIFENKAILQITRFRTAA